MIVLLGRRNFLSCVALSRLKGMETRLGNAYSNQGSRWLRCAVPSEGNRSWKSCASWKSCFRQLHCAIPLEGNANRPRRRGLKPRLPVRLRCAVPVEEKGKNQAILTYGGWTSRAPCSSRAPALEPRRRGLQPRLPLMSR